MKLGSFVIVFFCLMHCLCFFAKAQERDTVYLRNGQIMVGQLNKISLGIIEFDDVDLSIQNVKYHKIKTIKAQMRTYRIETIDKNVYFGVIKPSKVYGEVIVDNGLIEKAYPLVDIYNLLTLENKFIKKIKGTIGLGYSYTKSSDIGRTNFDWDFKFIEERYQMDFSGSFIFTNNQGEKIRDREAVSLTWFYNISPLLIGGLGLNYQRNVELGLASRVQQFIGLGRRFLFKSNLQGVLSSGAVINQERPLTGNSSGSLYELPVQFKLDYFHYAAPNLSFSIVPKFFLGLNQDGRKRYDGDIRVNWEVISNLNLGLQFYSNFDNQALEGSNTNFDYGIVFNVGYKLK